jgi:hypothetical protein
MPLVVFWVNSFQGVAPIVSDHNSDNGRKRGRKIASGREILNL